MRINTFRISFLISGLTILTTVHQHCKGYEPHVTHPLMSRKSRVALLKGEFEIPYRETADHIQKVEQGSDEEDSFGWRGVFHFYDPVRERGLHSVFPSAISTARPFWNTAITQYSLSYNGNPQFKAYAYESLGHVMHLIVQDMAQPGHVHNDPHLPHIFGIPVGDLSPLEDAAERIGQRFPYNNDDEVRGIGGLTLTDPAQFAREVANFTYIRSQFPGFLNEQDRRGQLSLPLNTTLVANARYEINPLTDELELVWVIRSQEKELRYWPSIDEDGLGFDSSRIQDWWKIGDVNVFYIDRQDDVLIRNKTLSQHLIEVCGPIGIQYGAGLLKLFHDIVNEPPYVKDQEIRDSRGMLVYESHVRPGSETYRREVDQDLRVPLKFDETYTVRLVFSEPVNNPAFRFDPNVEVGGFTTTDDGIIWTGGSFTIPRPQHRGG